MTEAATPSELDSVAGHLDDWLEAQLAGNPVVVAVDRDFSDQRRWFVRLRGEEKDSFAVWFTLGQRTLRYETFFTPAPEKNQQQFYEHLLRRNSKMFGAAFAVGDEDAIFVVGRIPLLRVCDEELDRVLGSLYAYVEQFFRPALRIGFTGRNAR